MLETTVIKDQAGRAGSKATVADGTSHPPFRQQLINLIYGNVKPHPPKGTTSLLLFRQGTEAPRPKAERATMCGAFAHNQAGFTLLDSGLGFRVRVHTCYCSCCTAVGGGAGAAPARVKLAPPSSQFERQ